MGSKHGHGSVRNIHTCCALKGTCNACAMTAHSSHSHDRKGENTNDNACSYHQKGTKHMCAFILGASVLGMNGPCLCAVTIMTGLLRNEHNYVTGPHGVKQCKRLVHTHSGCGNLSAMKRTQCTLQSMWCSLQHPTGGAG